MRTRDDRRRDSRTVQSMEGTRNSVKARRNSTRKKRKTRRRLNLFIGCYVVLILGCCFYLYGRVRPGQNEGERRPEGSYTLRQEQLSSREPSEQSTVENEPNQGETDLGIPDMSGAINLDELHSSYAILLDAETGQVLAEKNSTERMYPASMTKLLAALVAAEHTENWNTTIEIPQEIFSRLYFEHASLAGFEPGEKVTPEELLYGMLLSSGAECCVTYATWLAGDEETFVKWMNERAAELGMEASHFTNTEGLHDEDHYSTAADIAILLEQCLQNEILRPILSAESHQTMPTTPHPEGITLQSTLFQTIAEDRTLSKKLTGSELSQVTLLGGKTGYTSQAGLCLASFARVGDREYLLVTAGAEGNHYTEPFHIEDALDVYGQIAETL